VRRIVLLFSILIVALLLGCEEDKPTQTEPTSTYKPILTLQFYNLTPLTNGFHYQGWAIIDDQAFSTGKFNVRDDGTLVDPNDVEIPGGIFDTDLHLEDAIALVITIEPNNDSDPLESDTHVLGGYFYVQEDSAYLTADFTAALGDDFINVQGEYALTTPTDGDTSVNEMSGIWFVEYPADEGQDFAEGLFKLRGENRQPLPTLRPGWTYEGWVIIDDVPLSTGKFLRATTQDSSAQYSGSEDGLSFPGEDFLVNAPSGLTFPTDLTGKAIAVTIEPSPDNAPEPFGLKILTASVSGSARPHTTYNMGNVAVDFPTGIALISEETTGSQ
jgi:hypothetical protein